MASVHLCFIRLPERQRLPRCYTPHRLGGGLATAEDKSRMERLLGRLRRGGYLPADFPSVETLAVAADHQLFVSIASNPYHVLRCLYHEKEACGYNLRTRPHNFALPVKDDTNFVSRSLYAELKS